MTVQFPVTGRLCVTTHSDLECKRKAAEPEDICQNFQSEIVGRQ